jgi:AraC-like DNA-binding protein
LALTGSTSLPVKTLAPPVKRPSAKEPNGGRGGPRLRSAPAPVSSAGVIPVDLAFATGQVDPPDRLAAWRELISRVFLRLAITPIGDDGQPGTFDGMVAGHSVGEVRVWRVEANPMSAVRSRRQLAHLPVAQIAARWGFRSPAHFARLPGAIRHHTYRSSPHPDFDPVTRMRQKVALAIMAAR